jgi:hypothetical protein
LFERIVMLESLHHFRQGHGKAIVKETFEFWGTAIDVMYLFGMNEPKRVERRSY